ncbi:hypothetical protein ElyMa_005854800 [Elysia marginata]|uniref:Uncharacterized protein n=1 Tax=Elysia marginata TaxID=1093978 RepID=A0AAV4G264_9GAST|nr:hypothetical protein ElyMa_005854800 [Elysia marginata]
MAVGRDEARAMSTACPVNPCLMSNNPVGQQWTVQRVARPDITVSDHIPALVLLTQVSSVLPGDYKIDVTCVPFSEIFTRHWFAQ